MALFIWPLLWVPRNVRLVPKQTSVSGGIGLTGIERRVKSDAGLWAYTVDWQVRTDTHVKLVRAMEAFSEGANGVHSVPIWDLWRQPSQQGLARGYLAGYPAKIPHSSGALFSDGTGYASSKTMATATGAFSVRAMSLSYNTLAGNKTPEPGTYFSIRGRLHIVKSASRVSNTVTIGFWPPLRDKVAAGDFINFDTPRGLFVMDEGSADGVEIIPGIVTTFSLKFTEYLRPRPDGVPL